MEPKTIQRHCTSVCHQDNIAERQLRSAAFRLNERGGEGGACSRTRVLARGDAVRRKENRGGNTRVNYAEP